MKRILLSLIILAAAFGPAAAQNVISASDPSVTYIGRTFVSEDGSVSYDWSGVTAIVIFTGTELWMECSDTKGDWFNVWVDKEQNAKEDFTIKVGKDEGGRVLLASKLSKKGVHNVILQKRTEGEQGTFTVSSFGTDGTFRQARAARPRRIEIVGDSYTCGYGTESGSRNDPFKAETENCNLAYGFIIGRYFDADVQLVSHSGLGIARNYNGAKLPLMPERYLQTFDENPEVKWTPGDYRPDIVIIYLGTNDFSTGNQPTLARWTAEYEKLLKEIRDNYGDEVPVLCVASNANDVLGDFVREVAVHTAVPNVRWTSIQSGAHNLESDLGASWHPNYSGQRKVASCMIPYVSTLTGWEMPFKAVE